MTSGGLYHLLITSLRRETLIREISLAVLVSNIDRETKVSYFDDSTRTDQDIRRLDVLNENALLCG